MNVLDDWLRLCYLAVDMCGWVDGWMDGSSSSVSPLPVLNLTETTVVDLWGRTGEVADGCNLYTRCCDQWRRVGRERATSSIHEYES